MLARTLAILAAGSLAVAPIPALAQANDTSTPTANIPIQQDQSRSDILVILAALVGAALVAVLASQIGNDKPASP